METNKITLINKYEIASNWNFELSSDGFSGKFRIHFSDTSKKNSRYRQLRANNVYFEGFTSNTDGCYKVDKVTDAMIFVERRIQWILERLEGESRNSNLKADLNDHS